MRDNIFKPLTHLDREGPDPNNDRFQRRDNTNFHDGYFQNADTDPVNPQEGWDPDAEQEQSIHETRNTPEDSHVDEVDIYEETIVVEFYNDNSGEKE